MIKAVLITLSLIICCFTTLFFTRYLNYAITLKQINKLQANPFANTTKFYDHSQINTNYNETHPVINSLTRLIQIPLIGQFFMDQKIYQLAKIQHWQAILNQIPHIITTPANKNSFPVWFHKALAECNSGLLEQCEQSAKTAELIAGNKQQRKYAAWFYDELKAIKRGKNPSSLSVIQDL